MYSNLIVAGVKCNPFKSKYHLKPLISLKGHKVKLQFTEIRISVNWTFLGAQKFI